MSDSQSVKLSSLLIHNTFYETLFANYKEKIKITSAFLDKKKFVEDEIERIKNFLKPIEVTVGPGWQKTNEFNHSAYAQYSYNWLMSGQDWPIEQILKSAKSQYYQGHAQMHDEDIFVKSINHHLNVGAGYILYNKFLKEELNNLNKAKTPSYSTLLWRFLSNPWVVTIIGGLIIAFFAKRFGWI